MSIGSMGIGSYASWYQPPDSDSAAPGASPIDPSTSAQPEAGPSGSSAAGPAASGSGSGSGDASLAGPNDAGEGSRGDTPTGEPAHEGGEGVSGPLHGEDAEAAAAMGVSDRFFPLSTATMQTSVFDVVHIFSERGISAVPIVDEDGVVLNLYETVDIVVRPALRPLLPLERCRGA